MCQRYAKYMSGVIPRLQIQDNYLKQRYTKDMPIYAKDKPKLCQKFARSNSKATNSRQLPKAKICQRSAKYMPNICQRYARSKSKATNSRQLPKAKIY